LAVGGAAAESKDIVMGLPISATSDDRSGLRPRRPLRLSLAALALLLIVPLMAACGQQSTSSSGKVGTGPVVARVNGVDIHESDIAMAEDDLGSELQNVPPDVRREHLIAYLADIVLVSKAAENRDLHNSDEFKQRLAFLRSKLLMGALLSDHARKVTNDEALQQVYNEQVKPMGATEEVRARHILVGTEEEARKIVEQLKAGADFAELAKKLSKDPGASDGGDLGYFTKDQMVPEFANVAFQMYPGQTSNPVKTQFGWHIIRLEDRRNRPVPEFEKVREQIEAFVARRAQTEMVAQLREKAKIERLDKKGNVIPQPAAKK
jgi:peptidyl-prolyl cis-trans isomerase C